ncbi:MAG: M18 family aminopeptidase [Clostridia bacterium]|nr:M18 family aminopeptidase [Clostridia bacterium]
MDRKYIKATKELIDFIKDSPTSFQAAESMSRILEKEGFRRLYEFDADWDLAEGGKYYVERNQSSLIAFSVPLGYERSFMLCASHSDSPTYRLKAESEDTAFGRYIKLDTEGYGGMIASSWLDRPLSIAGRAVVRTKTGVESRLVKVDRDLLLIPNVDIHQNRKLNDGFVYNPAVDMMPLFAEAGRKGVLKKIIAETAGCGEEDLVSFDMFLYNRTPGTIWGADSEFFSSPRIDNLMCAYSSLMGFIAAVRKKSAKAVPVYACFDNEETGNMTKQGAASTFLFDTLSRICEKTGMDLRSSLPSSFMLSCDNGHAVHPNHPELSDRLNGPHINGGVVIKFNAAQKYASDAVSCGIFSEICRKAGIPVQNQANRSDLPGGGTLGAVATTKVTLNTVDIGMAQIAMHSSYETAGTKDTYYLTEACRAFYSTVIRSGFDGSFDIL